MQVEYSPVGQMIANFFTQPQQGIPFQEFCDKVMNVDPKDTPTMDCRSELESKSTDQERPTILAPRNGLIYLARNRTRRYFKAVNLMLFLCNNRMLPASNLVIEMSITLSQITYDQRQQNLVCHPKSIPSFMYIIN
jgi:hypothetical protein